MACFTPPPACGAPLALQELVDGKVEPLNGETLNQLGDPLFRFVLKDHAEETRISRIVELLGGDAAAHPRLFVVDEDLASSAQPAGRRTVLAFDGHGPGGEELKGNVMLSFFVGSSGWNDRPGNIEAWGWDDQRGRYNYYRGDKRGLPSGSPDQWRFRTSSVNADQLKPDQRAGTCLQCHANGGPVMKELLLPWNNWHSFRTVNDISAYLKAGQTKSWPLAAQPDFAGKLDQAEQLEGMIIGSLRRFNGKRLAALVKREPATGAEVITDSGGQRQGTVVEGSRLLRPLFTTTEVNLISSNQTSGRHPLDAGLVFAPELPIQVPRSLFLNAALIGGGSLAIQDGLKVTEANQFGDSVTLTRKEYEDLVDRTKVKWKGQVGDAHFAWLIPEPGFVENDILEQALKKGIVTPHFLAATLAVDLERPIFSKRRAGLAHFVPDQFPYILLPEGTAPSPGHLPGDELTTRVIAALEAAHPAADSAEADWLDGLKSPDAVARLRDRINQLKTATTADLAAGDPARRQAALRKFFDRAVDLRKTMLQHPVFGALDETGDGRLLPLP